MSYVLDALRRAEAERQRGRVPGLDAQPLPVTPTAMTRGAGRGAGLRWLGGLLMLLGALGAAGWLWQRAQRVEPVPARGSALVREPTREPAPPRPSAIAQAPPPPLARTSAPPPATARAPVPAPVREAKALPPSPTAADSRPLTTPPPGFPTMAFNGSIDSPQPSARMLIVNGQVMREGDELQPDLKLERISLRSAVFVWRGQRVEVPTDRPAGR
jgi:general secretion pathway protein B